MAELKEQKRAWWVFVHDLSYPDCYRTINELAVIGQRFLPRPGDIRRHVILGNLPDAIEAWDELQDARAAANSGNQPERLSELAYLTAQKFGSTGAGLHTGADRAEWTRLYLATLDEYVKEKCQVQPLPN